MATVTVQSAKSRQHSGSPREILLYSAVLFITLLLPFFLIFRHLGSGSIDLWDESLTAGRSLSFLHKHDPLSLSVNGGISLRKPPLIYMLNAASISLFGVNEFGLRFPNAAFGFGVFLVMAWYSSRCLGRPYAALAVALLAGCAPFIEYSREALTDTVYVFGLLLALLAFASSLDSGRFGFLGLVAYGGGLVIASLGKGLMVLTLPLYAGAYLACVKHKFVPGFLGATLLALLPIAVWMAGSQWVHPQFFSEFFMQEAVQRMNYSSTFLPLHIRSPIWYWVHLWQWSGASGYLAVVMGGWMLWQLRSDESRRKPGLENSRGVFFLIGFAFFYFAILMAASHKRSAYVLPLLPLFSLCIAAATRAVWMRSRGVIADTAIILLVVLAVSPGLVQTFVAYQKGLDHNPAEKALVKRIAPWVREGRSVYADDPQTVLIVHFYLDEIVHQVPDFDQAGNQRAIWISKRDIAGWQKIASHSVRVLD